MYSSIRQHIFSYLVPPLDSMYVVNIQLHKSVVKYRLEIYNFIKLNDFYFPLIIFIQNAEIFYFYLHN